MICKISAKGPQIKIKNTFFICQASVYSLHVQKVWKICWKMKKYLSLHWIIESLPHILQAVCALMRRMTRHSSWKISLSLFKGREGRVCIFSSFASVIRAVSGTGRLIIPYLKEVFQASGNDALVFIIPMIRHGILHQDGAQSVNLLQPT